MRRTLRPSSMGAALLLTAFHAACGDANAQSGDNWRTDFTKHVVPLEEIVSGGPPKDGIPAIDDPRFVSVRNADRWLDDREPVVVLDIGGVAKAYPLQILMWHEIVNDVVAGIPITITFCPLCNTALSFDRRFDGQVLDFGTTGRLRHSDLVMYDRQTETWWQQATGQGLIGEYAGKYLEFVASPLVSWATFKGTHPRGQVLSRETGHQRSYGQNPYLRYDELNSDPYGSFFQPAVDRQLPAKERVVALATVTEARAYTFATLREERVLHDTFAGRDIVIFWAPGMASALDASAISEGRDVGASGVFDRRIGSQTLLFEPTEDPNLFADTQTGSRWNLLGKAVDGELEGRQLDPVAHGNHFWFAWAVFRPDTKIR